MEARRKLDRIPGASDFQTSATSSVGDPLSGEKTGAWGKPSSGRQRRVAAEPHSAPSGVRGAEHGERKMPEMTAKTSQQELSHLLRAVDSEFCAGKAKGNQGKEDVKVSLENQDLWMKFKELTNEMIVTKSGRLVDMLSAVQLQ